MSLGGIGINGTSRGSGGSGITAGSKQVFEATADQTTFNLTTITIIGISQVFVNSALQDYGVTTPTTTQVVFATGLNEGDIVTVTGQSV